jgi:hypothetical protein
MAVINYELVLIERCMIHITMVCRLLQPCCLFWTLVAIFLCRGTGSNAHGSYFRMWRNLQFSSFRNYFLPVLSQFKAVRRLIHSLILSFVHSFIHSFILPFVHSFIHSSVRSFIHSFILPFVHSFNNSFIHSSVNSIVSSKTSSPQNAMWCLLFQIKVSFRFL